MICARIESNEPVGTKGAGWLHRLNGEPRRPKYEPHPRPSLPLDFAAIARDCARRLPDQDDLPQWLGLSDESLGRLGYGWDDLGNRYTFPMLDDRGNVIGIRTRYRDGTKRCIRGSRTGIFVPTGISDRTDEPIYVCEGPTDCAAMLDMGFDAIGRPSNTGGLDVLAPYLLLRRGPELVIVADRDGIGTDAERLTMLGVMALASAVRRKRTRIIRPPTGKDVRAMLIAGAGRAAILCMVRAAGYL